MVLKTSQKAGSFLLALVMLLSLTSVFCFKSASAATDGEWKYELENGGVWLFTVDTDANNLACYNGYEHLLYPLTEEQKKAFVTVKSVFRLDHLGFECLYVNENFATFGIANGRASFIYSKSNQKPDFVNLAEITDKNRVYVEKITDNWFYACK